MKKHIASTFLVATILLQMGALTFADEQGAMTEKSPVTEKVAMTEKGHLTKDYPVAWNIVSFPLRVVTGAGGAATGFVTGGAKGIADSEKDFASRTYAKAGENPLMAPIGLLGSVAAVPVGIIKGGPKEAADYGQKGFLWWNKF